MRERGIDISGCPWRPLEAVQEHRAVVLLEQVSPDLDYQIRPDAEEPLIESCVVDLAERQSVADGCDARALRVRDDVRGVQQFRVVESADSATLFVGADHVGAKDRLVKTLPGLCQEVPT